MEDHQLCYTNTEHLHRKYTPLKLEQHVVYWLFVLRSKLVLYTFNGASITGLP